MSRFYISCFIILSVSIGLFLTACGPGIMLGPERPEPTVFVADSPNIIRMDLDGSNAVILANTGSVSYLTVDYKTFEIYYSNGASIEKRNFDGTNPQTLVTGLTNAAGIQIDADKGLLFWVDASNGTVSRAYTDGTGFTNIITGFSNPLGIGIDTVEQYIYFSSFSGTNVLDKASYTGSGQTSIHAGLTSAVGVAVYRGLSKLYYAQSTSINRSNFDGTGGEIMIGGLSGTRGIRVDEEDGYIYWVETSGPFVKRAFYDGSGVETIGSSGSTPGLAFPTDIEVFR
jgi:hypothetical protein